MLKYLLFVLMLFSLTACSPENERYYQENPQALQSAIQHCSQKNSPHINCDQLAVLAKRVNELAYQLQLNPQAFGKKILAFQSDLSNYQLQLKLNPKQHEISEKIQLVEEDLVDHLAVVKWLESPK